MQSHQFPNSSSDPSDEHLDIVATKRGCCFWIPFLSDQAPSSSSSVPSPAVGGSGWWERIRAGDNSSSPPSGGSWWLRGWNRFREWSELVARPRLKTFIRRFSRNRMQKGGSSQFRYDPLSYALNFDEGPVQNGDCDRDTLTRDFSSRYASIPASCKSSMDLGHSGPLFM